jgi:pantothenate kinase
MSDLARAVLERIPAATRRWIVGIAGAPGVGKSTVAARLATRLDGAGFASAVLPMDGFHLPQERLRELGRRDRMGAPDTFDVDGFVATMRALRRPGRTVTAPGFDRASEEPVADAITIGPDIRVVIAEGNYLLLDGDGWERIAPLVDTSIMLTLDPEVRHGRLIARHMAFGKDEADARAWVFGPDEANALRIDASGTPADLTVALDDVAPPVG